MKKYIVYSWSHDNTEGYGLAVKGTKAHYPLVSFSLKTIIGEFDTIKELIQIIRDNPDYDVERAREKVVDILFRQLIDLEVNI